MSCAALNFSQSLQGLRVISIYHGSWRSVWAGGTRQSLFTLDKTAQTQSDTGNMSRAVESVTVLAITVSHISLESCKSINMAVTPLNTAMLACSPFQWTVLFGKQFKPNRTSKLFGTHHWTGDTSQAFSTRLPRSPLGANWTCLSRWTFQSTFSLQSRTRQSD